MNFPLQKQNSKGRSDYIETSIYLLESLFREDASINEIQISMNNRSIPSEFRSIAWRVFLKILPFKKCAKDWVVITIKSREDYNSKLNKVQYLDIIENILHKKTKFNELTTLTELNFVQSEEFKIFNEVYSFITENLASAYDLFKNDYIVESFIKVYLTYIANHDIKNFSHAPFMNILSALMYGIFPSIIHHFSNTTEDIVKLYSENNLDNNKITKELFAFLNSENYFDHDVYTIFETILETYKHKELILSLNKESQLTISNSNEIEKLDTMNITVADLVFLIIKIQKPELALFIIEKKFSISSVIKFWVSTFFSSTFLLDDVTYLLDSIFCNEEQLSNEEVNLGFINPLLNFHFLYFMLGSLLCSGADTLMKFEELDEFNNHLLVNGLKIRDFKQVLNKALTNREAMSLIFTKN